MDITQSKIFSIENTKHHKVLKNAGFGNWGVWLNIINRSSSTLCDFRKN